MDSGPIPEGLHSVTPYFTVQDADRLIDFLTAAFDAEVIRSNRNEDGSIQHSRLLIGDSIIMMNQTTEAFAPNVSQMHLFVANADEAYETALMHGATSIMEPNLRPHGDRMAGIEDPCGNLWWLATYKG
ncbi:MAG: VOC family protein [Pseudomonadota bacterium]